MVWGRITASILLNSCWVSYLVANFLSGCVIDGQKSSGTAIQMSIHLYWALWGIVNLMAALYGYMDESFLGDRAKVASGI